MFGLFYVNDEMWQKRFPTKAWGQSFEDQWRRLSPWEPVFRARITFLAADDHPVQRQRP